jgi:CrcB protein
VVSHTLVNRTLLVGIGGLVGSICRYWVAGWVQALNGTDFPVGTLAVNVAGSFIIGLLMVLAIDRAMFSAETRILLTTGFCGGFTTMSTFSYETLAMLREGSLTAGAGNIAGTLVACLFSTWSGMLVARWL